MVTRTARLISSLDSQPRPMPVNEPGSENLLLARGITALKAGDRPLARRLLALAVQQRPDSEAAWFWLSAALQTPQGRAFCLREVLARNPANQAAARGLEVLAQAPPAPALVIQPPAARRVRRGSILGWLNWRLRARLATGQGQASTSTLSRIARYGLLRALVLALTVVVGVFLAVVVINFGGFVDEIARAGIEWALMFMAMDMRGMEEEAKTALIDQARWDMEEAAGLHEPFLSRCVRWTWQGLKLDLGEPTNGLGDSIGTMTVQDLILNRLPNTVLLAGSSNLLLFILAVLVALVLSRKYGHWLDRVFVALSPISSAPNWVYGILLTVIFAAQLGWLPFHGMYDQTPPETQWGYVGIVLRHMILPVAAIFLSMFFQSVYAWRTFFLLHSGEDYVEMAEAKGLPPRMIERRYILRPTLPNVLTSFALLVIGFWQGALALEVFFRWPGIGALFVEAVWRISRSTVIGLLVIFAYLLALSILVLDVAYAAIDPRVKIGGGGQTVDAAMGKAARRRPLRVRLLAWFSPKPRLTKRPIRGAAPKRVSWKERFRDLGRGVGNLTPAMREIARYPSAVVGSIMVLILVGVSIYAVLAVPYKEAMHLWLTGRPEIYQNPRLAQPEWVNLFRRDDLPPNIVLDSRSPEESAQGEQVSKGVVSASENMTEILISFPFDYPYGGFPQDLAVNLWAEYDQKKPMAIVTLLTPDGRAVELEKFSLTSAETYQLSRDDDLRRKNALGGQGGQPIQKLFADPGAASLVPLQGTYKLQVSGFVFEEGSDLEAEMVLYGRVYGLAGTDHERRDLAVAMLWGAPVALVFGLVGAVGTSLLTMTIAATGVWFGGRVDGLIQRISEVNLILPALPIAITVYLVYAKSVWAILGVMVLLNIFGSALKNYRAMFLQIKESGYVEAARVYGASNWRIVFFYLVPRIVPVLVPQLVIMIPGYVFLEATLAFLGVSDVYLPTWGKVINDALTHNVFEGHYYWVLEPVVLLLLTGLAFALVGFALDRILNPRLREA
jgi:peptide/nickel transport system permease protein